MEYFIVNLAQQEILRLLKEAENKIERFEMTINGITAIVESLKVKREPILAALEYASREEARRNLRSLFVRDDEYGSPIAFSLDLLQKLEQRKGELDELIRHHESKRAEKQAGIDFIRRDIELLKSIRYLELNSSLYEAATLTDG